jgi:hypothetical protein
MTKARLFTAGALVYPLNTKHPRRRGVGGIESLSSHVAAHALHHDCSPYTLFSTLLIPAQERLTQRWRRVRWGESHLINSYGEVAAAVANAVSVCSGLLNARHMTFLGLEKLCDPLAKHFMHQVRPWCSDCYLEARQHAIPAWDALYTYARTTRVCVWHQKQLQFACSRCKMGQRYLPKFPFLDYCEHCGADLTDQPKHPFPDNDALEVNLWMARAALDLIATLGRDETPSAENFAKNIQGLMDQHFAGMERPFAKKLGLAGSSPKNWLKRGSTPTWSSLVDLGYRLDIPPACLGSAEAALTDPSYWRQRPAMSLDKPHVRPTQQTIEVVKAELATRLAQQDSSSVPAPEGLPRLAKRLQVSLGVLKRHFPEECAKLIAQRKAVLRTRVDTEAKAKTERVAAATAAVVSQHRRTTSRSLKQTGLVKVSDLVPTPKRSTSTPPEK